MMILDIGPSVAEMDIVVLEMKLNAKLPDDYREFLLSKNGGRPEPDGVEVPGYDETDVQILFGMDRVVESSCIGWNLETLSTRLPKQFIPIASDSGGNVFCISLTGCNRGSVLYADLSAVYGSEGKSAPMYEVDSSFEIFLGNLFD